MKYYEKAISRPPFGENLKGEIHKLRGKQVEPKDGNLLAIVGGEERDILLQVRHRITVMYLMYYLRFIINTILLTLFYHKLIIVMVHLWCIQARSYEDKCEWSSAILAHIKYANKFEEPTRAPSTGGIISS